MPLAHLERPEGDDRDLVVAEAPLAPHGRARGRRRGQRARVDPARHHADALRAHPDADEGGAHAFRDGDHRIHRAVVEETHVGAAGRDVVHAARDHEPRSPAPAERRQGVSARGVEVDHVEAGRQAAKDQRGAHVEVVRDAERDDPRARRGGGARQRPLRVRRDGRGVAARGEHADEGQDLDLAASPGALRVDVQHAHARH